MIRIVPTFGGGCVVICGRKPANGRTAPTTLTLDRVEALALRNAVAHLLIEPQPARSESKARAAA